TCTQRASDPPAQSRLTIGAAISSSSAGTRICSKTRLPPEAPPSERRRALLEYISLHSTVRGMVGLVRDLNRRKFLKGSTAAALCAPSLRSMFGGATATSSV